MEGAEYFGWESTFRMRLFDVAMGLDYQGGLQAREASSIALIFRVRIGRRGAVVERLFQMIARLKGMPTNCHFKCMAMVEISIRWRFKWRVCLEASRSYAWGLNLGRWDYMASLIHFNLENPSGFCRDATPIPPQRGVFP